MTERMVNAFILKTDYTMEVAYIPLEELQEIAFCGGIMNLGRPIRMVMACLNEGEPIAFYDLLVRSSINEHAVFKN